MRKIKKNFGNKTARNLLNAFYKVKTQSKKILKTFLKSKNRKLKQNLRNIGYLPIF